MYESPPPKATSLTLTDKPSNKPVSSNFVIKVLYFAVTFDAFLTLTSNSTLSIGVTLSNVTTPFSTVTVPPLRKLVVCKTES